jgi:hypothetical protein
VTQCKRAAIFFQPGELPAVAAMGRMNHPPSHHASCITAGPPPVRGSACARRPKAPPALNWASERSGADSVLGAAAVGGNSTGTRRHTRPRMSHRPALRQIHLAPRAQASPGCHAYPFLWPPPPPPRSAAAPQPGFGGSAGGAPSIVQRHGEAQRLDPHRPELRRRCERLQIARCRPSNRKRSSFPRRVRYTPFRPRG